MTPIKDQQKLQELAHKYRAGTITEAEKLEFDAWFNAASCEPLIIDDASRGSALQHRDLLFTKINADIKRSTSKKGVRRLWKVISIASSITVLLGMGLWFYMLDKENNLSIAEAVGHKISADYTSQNSYLKLSDGSSINLDTIQVGSILNTENIEIRKGGDGIITYKVVSNVLEDSPAEHELKAGVGERVQILLADGSKVLLNTQSKLRFPTHFENLPERKVYLSGEAYFEVAKNAKHPFIVHNDKQVVEVLGTQFNVRKYSDERLMKTTLVEGAVKINHSTILKPNQQALSSEGNIVVKTVDVSNDIDWIEGLFTFENENIREVMRKVARWYNLDVSYSSPDILKQTFTGSFSRASDIDHVLQVLEASSDLQFTRQQNRITVSK